MILKKKIYMKYKFINEMMINELTKFLIIIKFDRFVIDMNMKR